MSVKYTGVRVVDATLDIINTIYKDKKISLELLDGRTSKHLSQNEYVVLKHGDHSSAITRVKDSELILIDQKGKAAGLTPRNKEQHMVLDALLDEDIKTVILTGRAGVGKTILALACAMQKFDEGAYERLILTKPMTQVGKHGLGALPGDVDEKFGPYLQNYMCNIEDLLGGKHKSIPDLIEQYRIEFIPLQLILGASWKNSLVIADEIQVLDHDEFVQLGTRIGEGSKLIGMGDMAQRHEKIARERTGMYHFINNDRAKASKLVASIDLIKCERSEIAALFADVFDR